MKTSEKTDKGKKRKRGKSPAIEGTVCNRILDNLLQYVYSKQGFESSLYMLLFFP